MAAPALNAVRRESEAEVAWASLAGVLPRSEDRRGGLVSCLAWDRGLRRIQTLHARDWRCGLVLDAWSSGASNLQAPRAEPRGVTRAHDPRSAWSGTSPFLASAILRLGPRALLPPGTSEAWAHWAFSQIFPIITISTKKYSLKEYIFILSKFS